MEIIPDKDNKLYYTPYKFHIHEIVNNDLCRMTLFYAEETKNKLYYSIALKVGKRKKNVTLKQTGRNGLSCLIWARNALLEFEKYIIENKHIFYRLGKKEVYIFIYGDNNVREKVYAHGLKKYGYYYKHFKQGVFLVKKII